jgi:uroporphyrinogen-III synthase
VVITRSKEGNEELAGKLEALGFEAVSVETMTFLPPDDWSRVDASLSKLGDFDWLVFTSSVGARRFAKRMNELSLRVPWDGKPSVAAVGEKTRNALLGEGIAVSFVPSEYLTRTLAGELPRDRGRRVLLLRADIADPGMVPSLRRAGFRVKEHVIYRTSAATGRKVARAELDGADAIIFGSPSAVEGFVERLDMSARDSLGAEDLLAFCIGPVTARAAEANGFRRIVTPGWHTFESLLKMLGSVAVVGEAD